jgi:hypothetical protein
MSEKTINFSEFVGAVREFDLAKDEVKATSHTSAVSVKDWDRVQAALASREEARR